MTANWLWIMGVISSVMVVCGAQPNPENSIIKSGQTWFDTKNNPIHAHGGGFLYEKSQKKYYWFGTTQKQVNSPILNLEHVGIIIDGARIAPGFSIGRNSSLLLIRFGDMDI